MEPDPKSPDLEPGTGRKYRASAVQSRQLEPGGKKSARFLWGMVILAFVVLISAWTALIIIATKNRPAEVPIQQG